MHVSLHVMGIYPARLPLQRIKKHLQRMYGDMAEFSRGADSPTVGDPDLPDGYYSDDKFMSKLPQLPHSENLSLIFTPLPLAGNYFTRTVRNVGIITTHQAGEALRGSEFNIWHYLVLKCIQEIFWISCKIYSGKGELMPLEDDGGLFHIDRPGCLFNFSINKFEEQVEKLRWAEIELDCAQRARVKFNVPNRLISISRRALNQLTRPTFLRSFTLLLHAPLWNLLYGAIVGGLFINLLATLLTQGQSQQFPWYLFIALLVALFIFPLGVYSWNRFRWGRRHADS